MPVNFQWVRFNENDQLDEAFSLSWDYDLTQVDGLLYAGRSVFSGTELTRITDTGELDPDFTPIEIGVSMHVGPDGMLYGIRPIRDFTTEVLRYYPDGTPDDTYTRGTIDSDICYQDGMMAVEDGGQTVLVVPPWVRSLNAARAEVPLPIGWVARVHLTQRTERVILEPTKDLVYEADGSANSMTFIRTEENRLPKTARYRVRSGTAILGEHFTTVAEGELKFAAGQSRIQVPMTAINNGLPELDRKFYVDILREDGSFEATIEMILKNDDLGLEVRSNANSKWSIFAIPGDGKAYLQQSMDLEHWQSAYGPIEESTMIDLDNYGPFRNYRLVTAPP